MKYPDFWHALVQYQKLTRRIVTISGDPGPVPITKLGGVPWWPDAIPRPRCLHGHAMSFLFQIRLSDVYELGQQDPGLLSFHYCQECQFIGNRAAPFCYSGSWSWDEYGYDLRVFTELSDVSADNKGIIAFDVLQPHHVDLIEYLEAPSMQDISNLPDVATQLPEEWYFDEEEIDCITSDRMPEGNYSYINIPSSKIGGWPSWKQYNMWPEDENGNRLVFAGQLDWTISTSCAWGGGGYAYLFVSPPDVKTRIARWVLHD